MQHMSVDSTKECIYTALILLMEQHSYDKITVTDITKKAGVSRMSFYRHFDSKDDVIFKAAEERLRELNEKDDINVYKNSDEFEKRYLLNIKDCRTLLKSLDRAGKIDLLFPILLKGNTMLAKKHMGLESDSEEARLAIVYHTGGIFQLIKEWLHNDFKAPPDEVVKTIKKMCKPE